mmetsp:Transcript_22341/g.46575  ORF Transcript_22341/g.46575 Transcript_22341/m.46575 type:complete len:259 (-) Transcript_22341:143-919(-)|eukprot:CAMPEP_0172445408 /NCGR_PEP_ID=MMETSP1065-20121228/5240_1 /TAXON_ID=265537 /ORGANISM="Amphiprora paludosa, Strain CCMP125" /LENGTH=258 /DNA_ID=CAMNT_0013196235 /DNA_START=136 /DNA_END=912 /DNA_ORIENTATION=+
MGRKRSKTQKKKQAKATNKLAKVFAKKLGVGDVDTQMKIDSTSTGVAPASSSKKKKPQSQKLLAKLARETQQTAAAGAAQEGVHVRDFVRQQASLREREMRIEWKRNITRAGRSRKAQAAPKKQQAAFQFTPASFAATDAEKPVEQLIGETTQRVNNWNGLSSETPRKQLPHFSTPFSTPQSKPVAAPAWSPDAVHQAVEDNNPWAVLADDEEDEGAPKKDDQVVPLLSPPSLPVQFAFAPPTFLASTANAADIDPDL